MLATIANNLSIGTTYSLVADAESPADPVSCHQHSVRHYFTATLGCMLLTVVQLDAAQPAASRLELHTKACRTDMAAKAADRTSWLNE